LFWVIAVASLVVNTLAVTIIMMLKNMSILNTPEFLPPMISTAVVVCLLTYALCLSLIRRRSRGENMSLLSKFFGGRDLSGQQRLDLAAGLHSALEELLKEAKWRQYLKTESGGVVKYAGTHAVESFRLAPTVMPGR
jgi:hypothetical protein